MCGFTSFRPTRVASLRNFTYTDHVIHKAIGIKDSKNKSVDASFLKMGDVVEFTSLVNFTTSLHLAIRLKHPRMLAITYDLTIPSSPQRINIPVLS